MKTAALGCPSHTTISRLVKLCAASASLVLGGPAAQRHMIVLDPGHSHAAALFAQPSTAITDDVHVYAPPGPDVQAFLQSLAGFNARPADPTHWKVQSYIAPDFAAHMLLEPPGNVVVISGRNDGKIESILSSVKAGQNVIADKPWITERDKLPALEQALDLAARKRLIAYDCMTERFELAYRIQRELMRDKDVFGAAVPGSASDPSVVLQNLHSVVKFNPQGKVNLRPAWFFDVRQQGQAVADVGTHLVDLEMWTLFPDQAIDYRTDVKVLRATRSPIYLTLPEFERVTGENTWPSFLEGAVKDGRLHYDCNNTALFTIRGIYAAISDRWEYESVGALSDTYLVSYRGTKATIRVRQSKLENYIPELDVIPAPGQNPASVQSALQERLQQLAGMFPGLSWRPNAGGFRVVIPQQLREREGSTFQQLVNRFFEYVNHPETLPRWEKPNMIAKYDITTSAAALASESAQRDSNH